MLFALAAHASQLEVHASRPVVVVVDNRVVGVAGGFEQLDVGLEPGEHQVQIRSFMGTALGDLSVHIEESERLRLSWDRSSKTLYELVSEPLTSPSAPPQPASQLPLARNVKRTGSLTITGLSDISGAAFVQSRPLVFDSDVQGFVATGLHDSVVELHLTDNDTLRFHGAIDVELGKNRTCKLLYRQTAWTVACETTGAERRAD